MRLLAHCSGGRDEVGHGDIESLWQRGAEERERGRKRGGEGRILKDKMAERVRVLLSDPDDVFDPGNAQDAHIRRELSPTSYPLTSTCTHP